MADGGLANVILPIESAFPMRYALEFLSSIDRLHRRAYGYPGGGELHPQQELADGPIIAVTPEDGEPWIAVFHRQIGGLVESRVVAWPDERSFCVVYSGLATVVRAGDPSQWYGIDVFPLRIVAVAKTQQLVLFGDSASLCAYGASGRVWESPPLVTDDLAIVDVDEANGVIHATGFDASAGRREVPFTVDLETGRSEGAPRES